MTVSANSPAARTSAECAGGKEHGGTVACVRERLNNLVPLEVDGLRRTGGASRQNEEEEVPPDQLFKWQHHISADLVEDTKRVLTGVLKQFSALVLGSSSGYIIHPAPALHPLSTH